MTDQDRIIGAFGARIEGLEADVREIKESTSATRSAIDALAQNLAGRCARERAEAGALQERVGILEQARGRGHQAAWNVIAGILTALLAAGIIWVVTHGTTIQAAATGVQP